MEVWIPLITTLSIASFLAFLVIFIFRRIWKEESKIRDLSKNISLSIFSTLFLLIILEIVFGIFVVHSDSYDFTLAAKRWSQKYWNPINSHGYRDYEHDLSQNILFVVGDSFIAGYGIKKIDDRISGILAKKLGSEWAVPVLADNGWNTIDEAKAILNYPKKPTKIILSYFINDIEGAAEKSGLERPQLIEAPNKIILPIIDNSFVINWIYWRLYRSGFGDIYWKYLKRAYGDTEIWSLHKQELGYIISIAQMAGSGITFVVWPHLNNIDGSFEFTSKVVGFLKEQKVEVIDLHSHFQGRPSETLVVNAMDSHPNEKTNKEVAELVYKRIFLQN